jgi:hypothetical protein
MTRGGDENIAAAEVPSVHCRPRAGRPSASIAARRPLGRDEANASAQVGDTLVTLSFKHLPISPRVALAQSVWASAAQAARIASRMDRTWSSAAAHWGDNWVRCSTRHRWRPPRFWPTQNVAMSVRQAAPRRGRDPSGSEDAGAGAAFGPGAACPCSTGTRSIADEAGAPTRSLRAARLARQSGVSLSRFWRKQATRRPRPASTPAQ